MCRLSIRIHQTTNSLSIKEKAASAGQQTGTEKEIQTSIAAYSAKRHFNHHQNHRQKDICIEKQQGSYEQYRTQLSIFTDSLISSISPCISPLNCLYLQLDSSFLIYFHHHSPPPFNSPFFSLCIVYPIKNSFFFYNCFFAVVAGAGFDPIVNLSLAVAYALMTAGGILG